MCAINDTANWNNSEWWEETQTERAAWCADFRWNCLLRHHHVLSTIFAKILGSIPIRQCRLCVREWVIEQNTKPQKAITLFLSQSTHTHTAHFNHTKNTRNFFATGSCLLCRLSFKVVFFLLVRNFWWSRLFVSCWKLHGRWQFPRLFYERTYCFTEIGIDWYFWLAINLKHDMPWYFDWLSFFFGLLSSVSGMSHLLRQSQTDKITRQRRDITFVWYERCLLEMPAEKISLHLENRMNSDHIKKVSFEQIPVGAQTNGKIVNRHNHIKL